MTELGLRIRTTWTLEHFDESPTIDDITSSEQDWLIAGHLRDEAKEKYYPAHEEYACALEIEWTDYAIDVLEGEADHYPLEKLARAVTDSRQIRDDINDVIWRCWSEVRQVA